MEPTPKYELETDYRICNNIDGGYIRVSVDSDSLGLVQVARVMANEEVETSPLLMETLEAEKVASAICRACKDINNVYTSPQPKRGEGVK